MLLIHILLLGHIVASWGLSHSTGILSHSLSHILLLLHAHSLIGNVSLLVRVGSLLLRSICLSIDSVIWSGDDSVVGTTCQEHLILKMEGIWLRSSLRLRLLDSWLRLLGSLLLLELLLEVSKAMLLKSHSIDGDRSGTSCTCGWVGIVVLLSLLLLLLVLIL